MRSVYSVFSAAVVIVASIATPFSAQAQAPQWPIPGKTIRIVLPFPAGGAASSNT